MRGIPVTFACDIGSHHRCMKDWCRCVCHGYAADTIPDGQRIAVNEGRRYVRQGGDHGRWVSFSWWKPSHMWALVHHQRWERRYFGFSRPED